MYKEITFTEFCDEFAELNREDQFTYEGKKALFEYLEDYESQSGETLELDVIALCCEYSEYSTAKEAAEYYGFEPEDEDNEEETEAEAEAFNFLEDRTTVIDFDGGVIIFDF